MAQTDVGTKLYSSASGSANTYVELVSVYGVPATGSNPAKLDATRLTDTTKRYKKDRQDLPDCEFMYDKVAADEVLVKATCGISPFYFMVVYQDGSGAVIKGEGSNYTDAVSVGSVVKNKLVVIAETITDKTAAEVAALTLGS